MWMPLTPLTLDADEPGRAVGAEPEHARADDGGYDVAGVDA